MSRFEDFLVATPAPEAKSLDCLVRSVSEHGRGKIYQAYVKHLDERESKPEQSPLVKWVKEGSLGSAAVLKSAKATA